MTPLGLPVARSGTDRSGRASAGPPGAGNPLGPLGMQVAFIIPCSYPVIGAAVLHNVNWFYPAFMVIVGAHYLPFVFLYGMWHYPPGK